MDEYGYDGVEEINHVKHDNNGDVGDDELELRDIKEGDDAECTNRNLDLTKKGTLEELYGVEGEETLTNEELLEQCRRRLIE